MRSTRQQMQHKREAIHDKLSHEINQQYTTQQKLVYASTPEYSQKDINNVLEMYLNTFQNKTEHTINITGLAQRILIKLQGAHQGSNKANVLIRLHLQGMLVPSDTEPYSRGFSSLPFIRVLKTWHIPSVICKLQLKEWRLISVRKSTRSTYNNIYTFARLSGNTHQEDSEIQTNLLIRDIITDMLDNQFVDNPTIATRGLCKKIVDRHLPEWIANHLPTLSGNMLGYRLLQLAHDEAFEPHGWKVQSIIERANGKLYTFERATPHASDDPQETTLDDLF